MRVTLVTNVPAPYREPLYGTLDELLRARGGGLSIVFGARADPRFQWPDDFPPPSVRQTFFLNERPVRLGGRFLYVNPLVIRSTAVSCPDVVILGGFAPWIYAAGLWCRANRVPYLIWSGETAHTVAAVRTRKWMRRALLRYSVGCLAYGPAAAAYLEAVGVAADRITVVGNGIDIDAFARRVDDARSDRRLHRAEWDLAGPTILSVGGKGLDQAIAAVELVGRDAQILVAGARNRIGDSGRLVDLGRRPAAEMPMLYATADCLIHTPRADLWPHAINEALSAGIPVVASRHTGVPDAALTGPGCAVVDRTPTAIAAALTHALDVAASADETVRQAIRAPLRPWGVDQMARRIVGAAERALTC